MPTYKAPLEDIRFILNEVIDAPALAKLPGYEEATPDNIDTVLDAAAQLCEEVLFPLNQSGDAEGCSFDNGNVKTPAGFKDAYQIFREGGWTGLSCNPAFGGQGLPVLLNCVVDEIVSSANMSFGMYPGLSHGAYNAIEKHATDELKKIYLPKLVDGTWTGTMCLTEPHCGTDLGLIRTKADPSGTGPSNQYKITGTKIFISAGEHDLSENIIHLVLARLPDAPAGVKGISLFVVPKFLVGRDCSAPAAGASVATATAPVRNNVTCGSIEHKMGIKASATCVMNFDNATGWLVGKPHKGMSAMFTMMNEARMAVGLQGLGLAEVAYQNAVIYAKERLQMRSLTGVKFPDKPADPIIVHPDVRRNLLTMKALVEGCRALALWVGRELDVEAKHPDEATRAAAGDFVALMIPVIKSFLTDSGFDVANMAVQVYGGHGYIREHGVEQYVRDARITQIYEGTNGIQALDLVGRKMAEDYGRLMRQFFHPVAAFLAAEKDNGALAEFLPSFMSAFGKLQMATLTVAARGIGNPDEAGAAATDYLRLFAYVAVGFMWLKMAKVAAAKMPAAGDRAGFYDAKLKTARFYFARIMPQVNALNLAILSGAKPMMDFPVEAF
ncbi:MAG: acyl-CoA dehydrogenase C-terminal domain-containing protein [Alphaproteobacteria bacterium]|nr:acyl-CoA dehydrogenase C-terminal domain-containing protein [Alphaproteobacteria bacterium]